jgi:hypothetical protein
VRGVYVRSIASSGSGEKGAYACMFTGGRGAVDGRKPAAGVGGG